MRWTEITREKYRWEELSYERDMKDEEWGLIERLLKREKRSR